MAYFQRKPENEEAYERQFAQEEEWDDEEEYDDGFDELTEEEAPEESFSEEERREEKAEKYRMAAGLGSFGAILVGALVILGLTAFLIRMIGFVRTDFEQTFSLWATRF